MLSTTSATGSPSTVTSIHTSLTRGTETRKGWESGVEVNTKFGTTVELNVARLKDDSGEIRLTLWGEQAKGIEAGKKVKITGGFVKEFRGEKQLSLTRQGGIEVVG